MVMRVVVAMTVVTAVIMVMIIMMMMVQLVVMDGDDDGDVVDDDDGNGGMDKVVMMETVMVVMMGMAAVDFNPAFRLYLSTKLSNPKLAPEAYARLNVLNFSATSEGLVEQMLGIVVTSEAPDLEVQSELQRREIADYGKLVADMEDRVLELLSGDVSARLLDDEHAITTLSVRC